VSIEPRHDSDVAVGKCTQPMASFLCNSCAHACSSRSVSVMVDNTDDREK